MRPGNDTSPAACGIDNEGGKDSERRRIVAAKAAPIPASDRFIGAESPASVAPQAGVC